GLRIGVIGVAEHIVDKMMPAHFSAGVYFTLGTDEVQTIVKQLRKENAVDLIVVLSHFGFPQDVKLAEETEGLDVLLSSHTHNSLNEPVVINETIIIQSGCHGAHIGKLDVEVAEGKITDYKHELIEVSEKIPPVEEVQKMIDKAIEPYRKSLNTVIGRTRTDLNRYYQLESTTDNLLLQALMNTADTEVAFSNGWRYGAPIPAGPITMNDVWNIIPTNPPVSTVYMSGREMLEMLEENLENTFSADPYNQMGGYLKRCIGLKMYVKIENPKDLRIQNLFVGEEAIDEDRQYYVAFVTVQGVPDKYGSNRRNLDINAVDALAQYITRSGTVSSELIGTVRIV